MNMDMSAMLRSVVKLQYSETKNMQRPRGSGRRVLPFTRHQSIPLLGRNQAAVCCILLGLLMVFSPAVLAQSESTVVTPGFPSAIGINQNTNQIYVSSWLDSEGVNGGNLSVISGSTNSIVLTLPVGNGPESVAVNPVTNQIYVANNSPFSFSGTVSVIDGNTNTLVATIAVGCSPNNVAVNPATNQIYVTGYWSGCNILTVIDGVTGVTTSLTSGYQPISIAVNPVTDTIYVANYGDNDVTVIDGNTETTFTVPVGNHPVGVAVDSVTNQIYVANLGDNTATVIDGNTNSAIGTVPTGQAPTYVAANPATGMIYVANAGDNTVTAINESTNIPASLSAGSYPRYIAVDQVHNKVYVADYGYGNNVVTLIDGASNTTTNVPVTGNQPAIVAVNTQTNMIYVGAAGSNQYGITDNLTIIDGSTLYPAVGLSPPSLSFASQNLNTSSAPQIETLTNTGTVNLGISAVTIGGTNAGDFSKSADTCTGTSVPPGGACTVSITVTPTGTGSRSASLTFADNSSDSPQSIILSGTAPGSQASLSAVNLNFGNQLTNTTSTAQTETITSSGATNLVISTVMIGGTNSGDFSKGVDTCTGATIQPGNTCTVSVTFTPSATGIRSALLTVTDNSPNNPQLIMLSGTGTAPAVSLSTPTLGFGNQPETTTSAPLVETVTNSGTANLIISTVTMSGTNARDFAKSGDTCTGATVPPSGTCTVSAAFTPPATGSFSASMSIADNASNSPQAVALTGSGTNAQATLSPTSRSFGDQPLTQTSAPKTVTLTSSGTTNLNISSITFTGLNSGDFAETDNCPASLAPGVKCTISITFTASILGAETATLTLADSAVTSPQTVALSGTGIQPATLSPATMNFGSQAEGTTSAAKSVTLTNNLNSTVAISSIATTGDFAQTNSCGNSVAANSTCVISVTFTPGTVGSETGSLTVADGAASSPQSVSLAGTGVVPVVINPISLSFGNQAQSTASAVKNINLTNNLSTPLVISSIVTSGDFAQTSDCGNTVPANGKCTISVTFTPSIIGGETGSLTIVDGASDSPQTASLSGTGVVQAKVAPISETWSALSVGATGSSKNVTLTNNLLTALPVNITFAGANPGDFAETDTCSGSVAASSSCTITLTFTPSGVGSRTATLNVNDSANNSPQTVALAGSGK
jgi:YVTN family beta-propeller protein